MATFADKPKVSLAVDWTEFAQGWRVLILSLIGIATSVGVAPIYAFGTLVLPLQEAFGWSRGEIQSAAAFQYASSVLAFQLAGWLNKRYGLRPITLGSLLALALAYVMMTFNTGHLWQLNLGFALLAFAGVGTLHVTWTQLTCLWFEKNRGLALAVILCGTGLTALILPSLLSWAISQWGWRAWFWGLALLPLLITLPLSLLWMRASVPVPTARSSALADAPQTRQVSGLSLREALRSARFWIANCAFFLAVLGMMGMITNAVPLMRDSGLSAAEAASVFGAFGMSLIVGRLFIGYLVDRLWAPGVAFFVLMLPAVGCLLFIAVGARIPLLILACVFAGLGAGAEMDVASYLMARYFGLRDYSRIFALHMSFTAIGSTISPLLFGALFERTGSYHAMLTFCMVGFAMGALLLLAMGRYPVWVADKQPQRPQTEGAQAVSIG
ncbi:MULTISPECIES: MFS transporter [unclassified Pseudomonas]|uniref:MFS transporter n=1 Tax=unclassified Pseudomonas TaxID=196821 RepID=UPI0025F6E885|nr:MULTISPECIES: MFS transporter [unclassified Pseudomonas]